MCDQTEVSYQPGNVVWVKLKPVWWPGVVADSEELPPDILSTLRKTPIAIVKFFQETDVYEYVHKLTNIYHYNCLKKNEFIRKGLDIYRSKNRDAPSNMKLFPADVARAEVLTGGNPNILNDKMFQPEEKPVYTNLFASAKKSPKKAKPDTKKRTSTQGTTQQSGVPRIITHPRFIKLSSGLGTDYEVRERKQEPIRAECDEEDNSPPTTYRCPDCDFTTIRLNVIVLHNKSHTRNYAKPKPSKASKRKNISAVRVQERPFASEWKLSQSTEPTSSKISDTNGIPKRKKGRPRKIVEPVPTTTISIPAKTKDGEKKRKSRPPGDKPKHSTAQEDGFQESLLEDWAEYETEQDTVENGDTSLETSIVDTQEASVSETKPIDESRLGNKKDEFDFDDSEEQLVIDKSNIRAGRKIPRVLEDKSEEVEKNGPEITKKRKNSGVRGKHEEMKMEAQEETRRSPGIENVRKRRMSSGLRKKSEEITVENSEDIKKHSESTDVKKRKISRIGKISKNEEKGEENVKEEVKAANLNEQNDDHIIEVSTTEVVIEEHQIEIEETVGEEDEDDGDYEQISTNVVSMSPSEESGNNANEIEAAEFAQKVDELLEEVAAPSKLPEMPRSLKKEHIKSYNASLTKPNDDDDQIIESISLINDDSSDGFDEKKNTVVDSKQASSQGMENKSSSKMQNPTPETSINNSADNIEVTSDSSPEIVSVEMPTSRSNARKHSTTIVTALPTTPSRTPVRFTMTSRLKNINSNQMTQKSSTTTTVISTNTSKMLKAVQHQRLQVSKARSMLKQAKPANSSQTFRLTTTGQKTAMNPARSTSKLNTNKFIVVKPTTTQRPTTIDNIDLTRPRNPVVSSGQVSSTMKSQRSTPTVLPKTLADNMIAINKVTQKNMTVRSLPSVHKPISSTIEFVPSGDSALIPLENQSEIITVEDDIECSNDNVQTEEINYIVDEAGNVIAENESVGSTSKKEDILAKALQDTDVIPTEMSLSGSTILLESCNIVQNTPSTTVYESVTLNTPPIMSSFETPSRNVNVNPIPEISEYIIISEPD